MNIAIFGLGYVGCVSAACFARDGHRVIGVDVNPVKVQTINDGKSPIIEPDLAELIHNGVDAKRLTATANADEAISQVEVAIICVGTPSKDNGNLELKYVERVIQDIGQSLKQKDDYMVVVIRSTLLPGKAQEQLLPLLERASGKKAGVDFGFSINPEFLREGSAIKDFDNPSYTVIGQLDDKSGDSVARLYDKIEAPLYRVPLGAAEMLKYASNTFHALKVVFANEIGNIAQQYGIDSHTVMDIFVKDTKLNLSPYYLKPGFSFGGSCLGKDTRALLYAAHQRDLKTPVLEAILPSNELQTQKAINILLKSGKRKIGVIGLSFKANTDDLRESPAVEIVERLIGKGVSVSIYDREVSLNKLHGSNLTFVEQVLPHIGSLMRASLTETVESSEAIVIAKKLAKDEYNELLSALKPDQLLIDLVRLGGQTLDGFEGEYRGICW